MLRNINQISYQKRHKIAFKYTTLATAQKIIANRTLRLGRPTEMNDPFDAYIDDLFDIELSKKFNAIEADLVTLLSNDPVKFAGKMGVPVDAALACSIIINDGTIAQREQLLAVLASSAISEAYPEFKAQREALEIERSAQVAQFRNTGVFCATERNNNLLMWAHYADRHCGVVLGFRPDAARDSWLCLLEPVTYSEVRPSFYKPFDPPTEDSAALTPGAMPGFARSLLTMKSREWAYEEELRVFDPSCVPEGKEAVCYPFHPTELAELYIGLRMSESDRDELTAKARALNNNVAIYQARMKPGLYALSFEAIT